MFKLKTILVPIDFGDASKQALEMAVDFANRFDASLVLVHTWELPVYSYMGLEVAPIDLLTPIQESAKQMLDEVLAETKKKVPTTVALLKQGTPWREILDAIEKTKPDLVVMGTHGRKGISRAVLGSVAEKIVRTSPVPVLTVGARTAEQEKNP